MNDISKLNGIIYQKIPSARNDDQGRIKWGIYFLRVPS